MENIWVYKQYEVEDMIRAYLSLPEAAVIEWEDGGVRIVNSIPEDAPSAAEVRGILEGY